MTHPQNCSCDPCLLALMQADDREPRQTGWDRWYQRDYERIQRYVTRRCHGVGCVAHSDDIVQETFVIGFRNISSRRYRHQGKALCAYLHGIARNLVREVARLQKREVADEQFLETQTMATLAVDDAAFLNQVLTLVGEAKTRLPDLQQQVIDGLYRRGHTSQRVGAELAKSANNVRAMARRAVKLICEYLARRYQLSLSHPAVRLCLQMM